MQMNELNPASGATSRRGLRELEQHRGFVDRHIGTDDVDQAAMLRELGFSTRDALIDAIVPSAIRSLAKPGTAGGERRGGALEEMRALAAKNRVYTSYVGQGYYGTYTPGVILRNVLEESRLVHGLHALPAGNLAGPARSAGQFPDDDLRPYLDGDRQCVDA